MGQARHPLTATRDSNGGRFDRIVPRRLKRVTRARRPNHTDPGTGAEATDQGQPGRARQEVEHSPAFRELVKWRTGCEGRTSHLKRRYGWNRSPLDGRGRTNTWCGYGVPAHNLVKLAQMTEAMA
jgi:hypothetical protein